MWIPFGYKAIPFGIASSLVPQEAGERKKYKGRQADRVPSEYATLLCIPAFDEHDSQRPSAVISSVLGGLVANSSLIPQYFKQNFKEWKDLLDQASEKSSCLTVDGDSSASGGAAAASA